jgi:thioredoxin-related protein
MRACVGALLCLIAGLATAATPLDPDIGFFNATAGDYQAELADARAQHKQGVLLIFERDGCPYCQRLRDTVLSQPAVQAYYRAHFLVFPVDIYGNTEVTDFQGRSRLERQFAQDDNQVTATPTCQFYDLNGKPVVRYTGATSSVDEFLWLGEFVAQARYRDMKFSRYKQQRLEAKPTQ